MNNWPPRIPTDPPTQEEITRFHVRNMIQQRVLEWRMSSLAKRIFERNEETIMDMEKLKEVEELLYTLKFSTRHEIKEAYVSTKYVGPDPDVLFLEEEYVFRGVRFFFKTDMEEGVICDFKTENYTYRIIKEENKENEDFIAV